MILALLPAAWLWHRNSELNEELRHLQAVVVELSGAAVAPPAPAATEVTDSAVDGGDAVGNPDPAAAQEAGTPLVGGLIELAARHARENSRQEAERELAKMSLYLPDLTEEQKSWILEALLERNARKLEMLEKVMSSGLLLRMSGGLENLSEDDRAEIRAMREEEELEKTAEGDPLRGILTEEQFARHEEAKEQKRISEAEGAASDILKSLGQSFELSEEQKDAIFQAVAQFVLGPRGDVLDDLPARPSEFSPREEELAGLIREHLTEEQAALYEQNRLAERAMREQFLKLMTGGAPQAEEKRN